MCISHVDWKNSKLSRGEGRLRKMDKVMQPVSTQSDEGSTSGNGSVSDYAA